MYVVPKHVYSIIQQVIHVFNCCYNWLHFQSGSEASVIFQHLTGHQLEQACNVAQQEGDHQMALLIGQASGMDYIRDYLQHQLSMWEQSEVI